MRDDVMTIDTMPIVFAGHGTPMGAIEPSRWTDAWGALGARLPRPRAILSISAHWLTRGGALVTASDSPAMNYDMYGFPQPLYEVRYPAPGDKALAQEISTAVNAHADTAWGFDHGTWLVLKYMFPAADIPVVQLSMDYNEPPSFHYELARRLQFLRKEGILILCSGNFVHNLNFRNTASPPLDWALEFDATMNTHIKNGDHQSVIDFRKLGRIARLAHPTHDHFLPIFYFLGLKGDRDAVSVFTDGFQWPAVSMRSFVTL